MQDIVIPSSVTSIASSAFSYCTNLTSIIIQGEGVKTIEVSCFSDYSAVTSVRVSSASITFGDNLFTNNNDFRTAYTSGASGGAIGVPGTYTKSGGVWSR